MTEVKEARKSLTEIAVGDRVWVGERRRHERIQTVLRLTPTQIIVEGHPERYQRKDGHYELGGGMFTLSIIEIATADECAVWDAEQSAKQQKNEERKAEQARIEAKRRELNTVLAGRGYIRPSDRGYDVWQVTLELSEAGVRELGIYLAGKPEA